MAVLKCKMCGGDLEIVEGNSVCVCEYCGTKQTVPNADNEKKIKLFERANRLRAMQEFDKAYSIYESLTEEFTAEAEAYWGLVLCKYGIEYVDDPRTKEKVPTCHRSSFDSVVEDYNYLRTQELGDALSKDVYKSEAFAIEGLRRGILEISSKEDPYDIFICYKETDKDGQRTPDSVMAQEIYNELTAKGYRVFFSRITLEDKLGVKYEPYIFSALHSSKIMLVIGTDATYLNAVWVKNEWSRYLKLIEGGEKKLLIPCYKNMDPYDLPIEFVDLQAQDMAKLGAMQDLVRGIEKIIPKVKKMAVASTTDVQNLLSRAKQFLYDRDFERALEYFERVLDKDMSIDEAYWGAEMSKYKVTTITALARCHYEDGCDSANVRHARESGRHPEWVKTYDNEMNRIIAEKQEMDAQEAERQRQLEAERQRIAAQEAEKRNAILKHVQWLAQCRERAEKAGRLFAIRELGEVQIAAIKSDGSAVLWNDREDERVAKKRRDLVEINSNFHCRTSFRTRTGIGDLSDNAVDRCTFLVNGGISSYSVMSNGSVMLLHWNGHDTSGMRQNAMNWENVALVVKGDNHVLALTYDGFAFADGNDEYDQCSVEESKWSQLVKVYAGHGVSMGIKSNGTVVATGYNRFGQCNVTGWRNIVSVGLGKFHSVGLRDDGLVVATGNNDFGQCNVEGWRNVVAISASGDCTLGLTSEGQILLAGDTREFKGINIPTTGVLAAKLFSEKDKKNTDSYRSRMVVLDSSGMLRILGNTNKMRPDSVKLFDNFNDLEAERVAARLAENRCPQCGGEYTGVFKKVCSVCGKPKSNYNK